MRSARAAVVTLAPDRTHLASLLRARGCDVVEALVDCPQALFEDVDLAVIECRSEADDPGLELARRVRLRNKGTRIVVLAVESSETLAIEALRLGACDYLRPPFDFERLAEVIGSSGKQTCRPASAAERSIVGDSDAIRLIRRQLETVSPTDSSVLVTGETGTGKELIAEYLHRGSRRRDQPFVCINCAAIPDTLLESELFGYARGAFTGAVTSRSGKLAQANGGTVFFDEIGDMTPFAQAKILRAIESKQICPLGSDRSIRLDLRVVAATNRDLESMMKDDRFRADLYFRLNVVRIALPPLRERICDIPLLLQHLLPQYNQTFGLQVESFSHEALGELMNHSWPGNIRELKNVLEIIFLNMPTREVRLEHLPPQIRSIGPTGESVHPDERERLMAALLATQWNVSEAARHLHWSRMTLYRKLAKYNIASRRPVTPKSKGATGV